MNANRLLQRLEQTETWLGPSSGTAPLRAHAASLVGQQLEQRYRVLELIGRGGMSRVYRAEHVLLGREVAIKVVEPDHPELALRLQREARATASIHSDHVVAIFDTGRLPNGALYIVLEYLEGADLSWLVARDGPFGMERCLELGLQLCDALQAVHAAGIVHRDIKPANIFLTRAGMLKLLDFGIAKACSPNSASATLSGSLLGSPHYMAPEQIERPREVDARTDVYAAGASLFFMLTGHPPFEASSLSRLLVRICDGPAPRLALPARATTLRAWRRTLLRALARRPAERFQDAQALRAALLEMPENCCKSSHAPRGE
jgi:eukaryotic-like serine/threonine-protein kinase